MSQSKGDDVDPNSCLEFLCQAVNEENHEAAREFSIALEKWLLQGGLMPEVKRQQLILLCQSVDMLAQRRIEETR